MSKIMSKKNNMKMKSCSGSFNVGNTSPGDVSVGYMTVKIVGR